jgi:hypothetical protein
MGVLMLSDFSSSKFLGSDASTQVQTCRRMALEASTLVTETTDPGIRACYLDLKSQWALLANEIEKFNAVIG